MSGLFTKDIVVLDVTSRLISAIVGVKKAQSVFGIKSIVEKEQPGYADGEWFDEAATVCAVKTALSEAMRAANSRSKRLFIGVPGEFVTVVSKSVSVKLDRRRRIADDDIDYLLNKGYDFATPEFVLINTSAVYYSLDGEEKLYSDVRGMYAENVEARVSYILAERGFIKTFDRASEDLGFKDVRYVASNWAECVTLLDSEQRESAFVLIDVGYLSSSVSVAKGEGVIGMKSFSLGGAHISADICEALDVPFEYAEEVALIETTGIVEMGERSLTVTSNGENIAISGVAEGDNVAVYTMNGMVIGQVAVSAGKDEIRISAPAGQIYLVKVNDTAFKVRH